MNLQNKTLRLRTDKILAMIVENGIAINDGSGRQHAIHYLTANEVPKEIIARVLIFRDRRRRPAPGAHIG